MAAKMPEISYACEICGQEGLNDESMRDHMINYHIEGASSCLFCDYGDVSPEELLIHINTAHLDYLTPENELFDFVDDDKFDKSPINLEPESRNVKNINLSNNNYSNINNNNVDNRVSTSSGVGAEGSPLRTQLNLNLKDNSSHLSNKVKKKQKCMLCGFVASSPTHLEEHINRDHFDLTSPSAHTSNPGSPTEDFRCPLCAWSYKNSKDLELHVNMEHRDILSPAKPSTPGNQDNWNEGCPVCSRSNFKSNQEMIAHVEEHFNNGTPATPDLSSDRMFAREIEEREMESRRQREQREFEMLQAQYGMDNQGNFKEQSLTNMQKAVYAGEMSVSDFYERQIELRFAENNGIDDGSSCTKDLIPKIKAISQMSPNVIRVLTCTSVDHYASTYGDKGWGCGYRNLQMLISSLLYHTGYNSQLLKPNSMGGCLYNFSNGILSRSAVPSISRLQQHIEWAWRQGFDVQGCDQLGGKLYNTRKWIGATEVVTVLSSLKIRCQLIDFDRPTSPDGSHPELFNWVLEYFQKFEEFKPPLYLQHQGHSRTIVGIEEYKDGHLTLLVFDPSHVPEQMYSLKNTATGQTGMRLIRRTLSTMKARQYQLVAVRGIMETENEYQQSKLLSSTRISQGL